MRTKSDMLTLIAAILVAVGVVIYLFLTPVTLDITRFNSGTDYGKSSISIGLTGMDVIFGVPLDEEVNIINFNPYLFFSMVITIIVCIMLFLDRFGIIYSDYSLIYIIVLFISVIVTVLSETLVYTCSMLEYVEGPACGISITITAILSGICFLAAAFSIITKKWGDTDKGISL